MAFHGAKTALTPATMRVARAVRSMEVTPSRALTMGGSTSGRPGRWLTVSSASV